MFRLIKAIHEESVGLKSLQGLLSNGYPIFKDFQGTIYGLYRKYLGSLSGLYGLWSQKTMHLIGFRDQGA